MSSEKKNRGIIVFLLLLILIIGFLSYQNAKDYQELQTAFQAEKNQLEIELDKIITDYDNVIDKKIKLSTNLRGKRSKVIQLRDTIKNLQEKNYSLIRRFRKEVANLEKENRELFARIDSLNQANNVLKVENVTVKEELDKQGKITKKLAAKYSNLKKYKESLEDKVLKAAEIEVDGIEITPMKLKSNGDYTTTSRSKRTDAFRLTLNLLRNEVAKPGKRKVYVSVVDMDKNVISADGHIILKDGSRLVYSDTFNIDYRNSEISLVSLVKVNREHIKKGNYLVSVYLEGTLVGDRVLELR
ncbi:hypothetical protein C7447_101372 [Tenacibaculum adriaticum]|uniref:Cell division protein ZapB n=1 Tax=Tenacibaculum adriaticum TaxID=413713 RepID=A0A5S5DWX7_9FLAO|nr:hypothetical protein [Tenacibaculum adriaticum]TYP99768.1 hypothetical protein C7447_101372 [Tenacibaculum adriaticum]